MLFGYTLDKQLAKRAKEVKFCKKCVVSSQRPRITFDENEVCSACNYAHKKNNVIDWKERENRLLELLDKYRSKDGSYDCVVPGSGGKDSSFVAHQLKHKYRMHPLTITWAPFLYTDIGWQNYLNFKDAGFDNLLCFPNGIMYRKFARLSFELIGDAFLPFVYANKAYPFQIALKFNIPLIFYGENGEVEYGGSLKNEDKPFESTNEWKEFYFKGAAIDELIEHGLKKGILTKEEIANNDLLFYRKPALQELEKLGVQMHWFSYYKKWIPQEHYYYAVEHTGFQPNPERSEGTYSKYASLDDKTDGFHFYLAYIKFGIGRATSDAAHEIRDGHLTREEGVSLVKRYDGEFPKKYFKEFMQYLNITEKEFWEVIDFYRDASPHIWARQNGEWKIRHNVSKDGVDD